MIVQQNKTMLMNRNKVIIPPIKSQGIKTKLVPWIMDVTAITPIKGKWIEPFLGTGVVAFNSGFKKALLNDINPHIINFYKKIQDRTITPAVVKNFLEEEGAKCLWRKKTGMFILELYVTALILTSHRLTCCFFPVRVLTV